MLHPVPSINELISLVRSAGNAILDIYHNDKLNNQVTLKKDASPLTLADQASHEIIVRGLQAMCPEIPVLSEEGISIPYDTRKHWEYFWCVDPLDGTKEFIKRNGEFAVNIALIHKTAPVLGIIYIPTLQTCYYGSRATGGWKITTGHAPVQLQTDNTAREWIAVKSRSAESVEIDNISALHPVTSQVAVGSSLKFCLIAEGKAHFYFRNGPTMEWDTAAGHAIILYSGGVFTTPSGEEFHYNKQSLVNGPFICRVNP